MNISERLQTKEGEHTHIRDTCYRTEAELTAARARVAELNLESERTRGRLELQAKQIGAIGERLAANETETQDLEARRQQRQGELDTHATTIAPSWKPILRRCMSAYEVKPAERDTLQNDLRTRERGLEDARMRVLQLLGEVSTLRNQVVQIDEYVAAIERDSARAPARRRDRYQRFGSLGSKRVERKIFPESFRAQQLELESLADRQITAWKKI